LEEAFVAKKLGLYKCVAQLGAGAPAAFVAELLGPLGDGLRDKADSMRNAEPGL